MHFLEKIEHEISDFEKCCYLLDKLYFQKEKEIENASKCRQCLKRKISSIFTQACYWCSMHQEVAIFLWKFYFYSIQLFLAFPLIPKRVYLNSFSSNSALFGKWSLVKLSLELIKCRVQFRLICGFCHSLISEDSWLESRNRSMFLQCTLQLHA